MSGMEPIIATAALGAQFGGQMISTFGAYQGQQHAAETAKRAARVGKIRAKEVDTHYREELEDTLANIDAIRASAAASPFSPTAQAIKARETQVSDRQRRTAVTNELMQAEQSAADAEWYRRAGMLSLVGGSLGAIGGLGKGYSSLPRV